MSQWDIPLREIGAETEMLARAQLDLPLYNSIEVVKTKQGCIVHVDRHSYILEYPEEDLSLSIIEFSLRHILPVIRRTSEWRSHNMRSEKIRRMKIKSSLKGPYRVVA